MALKSVLELNNTNHIFKRDKAEKKKCL